MSLRSRRQPSTCPLCGFSVPVPEIMVGMWNGAKANGAPAGGGVHEARCGRCRAGLVGYSDVYDESGHIIPESGAEAELTWSLRGVPWQTIILLVLVVGVSWTLLRMASRP